MSNVRIAGAALLSLVLYIATISLEKPLDGLTGVLEFLSLLVMPVVVGYFSGSSWGFKGLLMSPALAVLYVLVGYVHLFASPPQPSPGEGLGGLGAAIALGLLSYGFVLVLFPGMVLFFSLIAGIVGAVVRRRRRRTSKPIQ